MPPQHRPNSRILACQTHRTRRQGRPWEGGGQFGALCKRRSAQRRHDGCSHRSFLWINACRSSWPNASSRLRMASCKGRTSAHAGPW